MTTEERIGLALGHGDADAAAEALVRGYGPEVHAFLARVLGSADDAADAFSFWAEDVWRGVATLEAPGAARVWAYRCAWSCAGRTQRTAWRRRRVKLGTSRASRLAAEVASSSRLVVERAAAHLDALRRELTPEENGLLVLRLDRALSWREVSEVLSGDGPAADEAALRKRFERIKGRLRRLARERGLID